MNSTTEILDQRLNTGPGLNPPPILENPPSQSAATIDGLRSALFGIPFIAAGVWISLAAFGVLSVRQHAPNWAIGIIGPLFFLGGLFFLIHGLRGAARKARYLRETAQCQANRGCTIFTGATKASLSPRSTPCSSACWPLWAGTPSSFRSFGSDSTSAKRASF